MPYVAADYVADDYVQDVASKVYVLRNNFPSQGFIAWYNLHMVYAGVEYAISDGATPSTYVYWRLATPNTLLVSDTFPVLGVDDALVFINDAGVATSVLESTVINGGLVVPGTIKAGALAADSVSATNLAADAVRARNILAGSISADKLSVSALSAVSANLGTVTAGKLQNASGTTVFDLDATTATGPLLKVTRNGVDTFVINADGTFYSNSPNIVEDHGDKLYIFKKSELTLDAVTGLYLTPALTYTYTKSTYGEKNQQAPYQSYKCPGSSAVGDEYLKLLPQAASSTTNNLAPLATSDSATTAYPESFTEGMTCALSDGRILVLGGRTSGTTIPTNPVRFGTPSGGSISWVNGTGGLPVSGTIASGGLYLLKDGRVVLFGFQQFNGSTWVDTATCYVGVISGNNISWSSAGSLPVAYGVADSCELYSNSASFSYFAIVGGYVAGAATNAIRIGTFNYSTSQFTWVTSALSLPGTLSSGAVGCLDYSSDWTVVTAGGYYNGALTNAIFVVKLNGTTATSVTQSSTTLSEGRANSYRCAYPQGLPGNSSGGVLWVFGGYKTSPLSSAMEVITLDSTGKVTVTLTGNLSVAKYPSTSQACARVGVGAYLIGGRTASLTSIPDVTTVNTSIGLFDLSAMYDSRYTVTNWSGAKVTVIESEESSGYYSGVTRQTDARISTSVTNKTSSPTGPWYGVDVSVSNRHSVTFKLGITAGMYNAMTLSAELVMLVVNPRLYRRDTTRERPEENSGRFGSGSGYW